MSGLYGLLDFNDYIIDYHLEIKKGGRKGYNWCDGEINSIILSYVKSQRIEDENVFYCLSDSYRLALNPKDNWFNLWKGDDRGKNSAKELYDFLAEIIM